MATVYLGVAHGPSGFNKLVVIKQLHAELAEEPDHLAMFLDEARLAARLSHPNVAQTNEVGSEDGRHFISMEFLDGQPLNRVRRRYSQQGGVPLAIELRVISDVLAGLQYAHNLADYDGTPLRVVHRDVSPHNVFVTYDGQVKLLDFGIAKTIDSTIKTRTGSLKGKVGYMPPEQVRGDPVDLRGDLFAIGVMLWEAATRTRMWKGLEDVVILQRVLTGAIPSPRSVDPQIDERLDAICRKALAISAVDRYASAAELRQDIERFADETGAKATAAEAGAFVAQAFATERKQMAALIDEQIRSSRVGISEPTSTSGLPRLALGTDSYPSKSLEGRGLTTVTPASSPNLSRSVSKVLVAPDPPVKSASAWAPVALSAGVAAFVAVAMTLWLKGGRAGGDATTSLASSASSAIAAAPTSSASAAPAPSAVADVAVKIMAMPASAKIFLDDAPVGGSSFVGKRAKDGAVHHVRIEAPGFDAHLEDVVFDADVALAVSLDRSATRSSPGKAATAPAGTDASLTPPKKRKQDIDSDNPYAR